MAIQASLFDNLPLDNARNSLEKLEFDKAIHFYNEALEIGASKIEVQSGISACNFWFEQLSKTADTNSLEVCKNLLQDYLQFDFASCPAGLKKNLLREIAEEFCNIEDADLDEVIKLFDLLLENKFYSEAANLIANYQKIYVGESQLYYYLAQAQFKEKLKAIAIENYIRALLLHPDINQLKKIEDAKLKYTIQSFGMHWAPAYSLIKGVSSNVSFDDTSNFTEGQKKYYLAYQLILQAKTTSGVDLELRKKINDLSPDLLKEYLKLQERKK